MRKNFLKIFFCFTAIFFGIANAQTPATIAKNTPEKLNYTVLPSNLVPSSIKVPAHQIMVLDFFSFGCPHCYRLHTFMDQWVTSNATKILPPFGNTPKDTNATAKPYIIFQPVPVAFESGWDTLAKAYHIMHRLGLDKTLNNAIFETAQNPLLGLNSDAQLRSFFLNHNVSPADYDKVANSPDIQADLKNDQALMAAFKLMEIPSVIVINGNKVYDISNRTVANADPNLFIQTLAQLTGTVGTQPGTPPSYT